MRLFRRLHTTGRRRVVHPLFAAATAGLVLLAVTGMAKAQDIPGDGYTGRPVFWAERARERGITLPPTYGLGLIVVSDDTPVFGDQLSVRLGKDQLPDNSQPLVAVPGVTFNNTASTKSLQIKADAWVLPFLNLFVGFGKVQGDLGIDVAIDADELLPPPICGPRNPCGIKHLHFRPPLDNTSATVGATLAYGGRHWFMAVTGTKSLSIASADRSDITATNAGLRIGPRLVLGPRVELEPYVGINYFDLDAEVKGTTSLADAFPDGGALTVRYKAHVRNVDDHSLLLGANAMFGERLYVQGEYGHADHGERFIMTATYRF